MLDALAWAHVSVINGRITREIMKKNVTSSPLDACLSCVEAFLAHVYARTGIRADVHDVVAAVIVTASCLHGCSPSCVDPPAIVRGECGNALKTDRASGRVICHHQLPLKRLS